MFKNERYSYQFRRYYDFEDYDDMIRGVTENDEESKEAYMLNENKR